MASRSHFEQPLLNSPDDMPTDDGSTDESDDPDAKPQHPDAKPKFGYQRSNGPEAFGQPNFGDDDTTDDEPPERPAKDDRRKIHPTPGVVKPYSPSQIVKPKPVARRHSWGPEPEPLGQAYSPPPQPQKPRRKMTREERREHDEQERKRFKKTKPRRQEQSEKMQVIADLLSKMIERAENYETILSGDVEELNQLGFRTNMAIRGAHPHHLSDVRDDATMLQSLCVDYMQVSALVGLANTKAYGKAQAFSTRCEINKLPEQ